MRSSFSMFLLYHAYIYLELLILTCTIYILAPLFSSIARLVSIISIIGLFSYFDSGFNVASSNNNINQIPVAIDHLNVHPKQIVISFINPHVTIQLRSTMKIPIIPIIFKKGSFIYLFSFLDFFFAASSAFASSLSNLANTEVILA